MHGETRRQRPHTSSRDCRASRNHRALRNRFCTQSTKPVPRK
jgi:hypothetical protein